MLNPERLSIWSEYFRCEEMTLAQKAAEFRAAGFMTSELSDEDGARLLDEQPSPAAAGRRIREAADAAGIRFRQGHLWLGAQITGDGYREKFAQLRPWLDMYLEAGIPRGVLHANSRRGMSYAVARERKLEVLGQLRDYLKGTELVVCLENCPHSDHAESAGLLRTLEELDSPNFGVCLDTGHLNIAAETQADFIRACGGRLKALHLADNQGETDQHMMPFGRGSVDFTEVLREADAAGYDGAINFEIPGESGCPIEVRRMKLRYLREVSDYLLAQI